MSLLGTGTVPYDKVTPPPSGLFGTSIREYAPEDFGNPEYRDPVVPVQILLVLMTFTVALIDGVFKSPAKDLIFIWSTLCGVAYLLAFMFYLTEYHEKLWEPYLLLPEDKLYCRFYSIFIGVIVLSLMPNWPEHWGLYVLGLFFLLYSKKVTTRNCYQNAIVRKYGSIQACSNNKELAVLSLTKVFTRNFLVWGVFFFLPFVVVLEVCVVLSAWSEPLEVWNGLELDPTLFKWAYVAGSGFITAITVYFWKQKITHGLLEMKHRVEAGDADYFDRM